MYKISNMKFWSYPVISLLWKDNFMSFNALCKTIQNDLTIESVGNNSIEFIIFIQYSENAIEIFSPLLYYKKGDSINKLLTPYYDYWLKTPIEKRIKIKGVWMITSCNKTI